MRKKIFLILYIIVAILLTGCWDVIEINRRNYIASVGFDINEEAKNKEGADRFLLTFVYPIVGAAGQEQKPKAQKAVISTTARTVLEGSRQLSTRTAFPFDLKHMKVILIGEGLFREPEVMKEIFDGIGRDKRINRKVKIVVVEGKAKDILEITPKEESFSGLYLNDLLENDRNASRFTAQTYSDLIKDMDIKVASLVPRAVPKKTEIKLSGGGIIKDYKLVGWIGEEENRNIAIVNDKIKSEIVNVNIEDTAVSYILNNVESKKNVKMENGKIKANIKISIEGYLQKYKLDTGKDVFDVAFLDSIEKSLEKEIKREIEDTIDILQKKYSADVIGIGDHMSKFEPDIWEKVKDNWDETFSNIDINVSVDAKVRRTGLIR